MSVLINEKYFFSNVLPHIGDTNKIIEELIENSLRANAKNCSIEFKGNKLICGNDGDNLEDFSSLFVIAESGYDPEIIKAQKPAGMGVMMMLAASKRAVFHSGNKKISLDSQKFFSSDSYRKRIAGLLQSQSKLISPNNVCVNGFVTTLTCDSGFIDALINSLKPSQSDSKYKFDSGLFAYYEMNIRINGHKIKRKEHEWIGGKSFTYKSAEVGITQNNKSGVLYWFGKEIKCPALAPFTVVVNKEVDFIVPSLPDRKSVSTHKHKLDEIHSGLESIMKKYIQSVFDDVNSDKPICPYDSCFSIMKSLRFRYDVEHFTKWASAYSYLSSIGYEKDVIYTFDDTQFFCNDKVVNRVDLDLPDDANVKLIAKCVGATDAPKRFLDAMVDRVDIVIESDCKTEMAGNIELCQAKAISVNGNNISHIYCPVDGFNGFEDGVFVTSDAYSEDVNMFLIDAGFDVDDTFASDLEVIVSNWNKCVKVGNLWWQIQDIVGCNVEEIKSVSLSPKTKPWNDYCLSVMLSNGEERIIEGEH